MNDEVFDRNNLKGVLIYKFDYLPHGLFNRLQVRLFQYTDEQKIWSNKSFLKKNNHGGFISYKEYLKFYFFEIKFRFPFILPFQQFIFNL